MSRGFINSSEGPIGTGPGSLPPKAKRNARLTTRDKDGKLVRTSLWIKEITTDLDMKINASQKKDGVTYHPERMQSRTLKVVAIFPANKVAEDGKIGPNKEIRLLSKAIKQHWAYNLNSLPLPMKLSYYGINRSFRGFIENIEEGASWDDVAIERTLKMVIIRKLVSRVAYTGGKGPYIPVAQDVRNQNFGTDWYNFPKSKL